MDNPTNIYDFVKSEINSYESPAGIELADGWEWSMKDHLRRSYLYLNAQFEEENKNRTNRPFKNIILPIMNVQFRTVDFDVKDITIYVDDPDEDDFQSLIISKYHNTWALEKAIDTFIDRMVTSYSSYGGVLVKKTNDITPRVINLRNLAFCNQTNILAYPFGIRHKFSFAELRKANKKWGDGNYGASTDIETLIGMVKKEGKKEVELCEVHGLMPIDWMDGTEDVDYYDPDTKDVYQMQIVGYYKDENKQDKGVTLFKKSYKDIDDFFKFLARDEVEGRALGRGGVEELFDPQQWTNKNEIFITEMLASASKTVLWSDDPKFQGSNNLIDVENNEVLSLTKGSSLNQVDTYPRNIPLFNDSIVRWQDMAQRLGAAADTSMGVAPSAGTPFKSLELQTVEANSPHLWRQGKIATFLDEVYRDWLLPHFAKEVCKEQVFMDTLSADEMGKVVNRVVKKKSNQFKKNMILAMQDVNDELVEIYENQVKTDVVEKGNERFFKILKDVLIGKPLKAKTNIVGKQKNLALLTDKLVGVFRQFFEIRSRGIDTASLGLDSIMNDILEGSGLSPMKYNTPVEMPQQVQSQGGGSTQPLKEFGQKQVEQQ